MESGVPLLATESTAEGKVVSRRRPLHTCGVSILEIARIFCIKLQDFSGPIGSIAGRITAWISSTFPFIFAFQNHGLAFLSFADDHILAIESLIEAYFPPSGCLFNKIDKLVLMAEALPGKLDDAMDKFPAFIHQVPLLDSIVVHLLSWLNFLISRLTDWDSNYTSEKDIMIDMNFEDQNRENYEASMSFPESSTSPDEAIRADEDLKTASPRSYSPSYKEMLERDTKDVDVEDTDAVEENPQVTPDDTEEVGDSIENGANRKNEENMYEDPILVLFESSWHMNTSRGSLKPPSSPS